MARSAPASDRDSSPPTIRSRKQRLRPDTPNLQAVPLAQKYGPDSMEELARLAKNAESEAARIAATLRYVRLAQIADVRLSRASRVTRTGRAPLPSLIHCSHVSRACGFPYAVQRLGHLSEKATTGVVTQRRACGPPGGPIAKRMQKISYSGYRFPPEIIQQAIWLYLRFTLSLRDVEDLFAERGVAVSYETVRRWGTFSDR